MATSVCRPAYEEELLPEYEEEYEDEASLEDETEEEISPVRKVYPDAVMEHLGELAAEAETEDEAAEHFLPLIGMAASKLLPVVAKAIRPGAKRAIPRVAKVVSKLTPSLTKGVGKLARSLHRAPGTRPLLRAVPAIARKTVHSIAKQVAHNRRVTPRSAVLTLAKQTRRVLGHPHRRAHALRRHHHLDRRFHRGLGRGVARAHYGVSGGVRVPGVATSAGAAAGQRTAGGRAAGTAATGAGAASRSGSIVAGRCVCPPCPACAGTGAASHPATTPTPAPAYCRCCGQVLR
jgi:hypothetical protein